MDVQLFLPPRNRILPKFQKLEISILSQSHVSSTENGVSFSNGEAILAGMGVF